MTEKLDETKPLKRNVYRETVERVQLECPECKGWFLPKTQPPRSDIRTCGTSRCVTRRWRRVNANA